MSAKSNIALGLMFLGGVSLIGLSACSPQASIQNETVATSTTSEFKLEYEKVILDNGLEVILSVDKSDPIVAVTTIIHAGSNREKPGRTGFAHFFEHMAFNDSENVPRGWNRKAIPEWGGQRNGATWSDGTIYYEVVPKDAFDKILWIDSDRLGYMINTVTQAALDREKQVVKNEKRQRVDNAPYGYTGEVIRKNLYPEGHPYSWTVIGSLPDLQAATLEDLKEFYAENYGPNNATLSIVGDIDIEETKRKVQQWFGEIPRGKDIKPLPPMLVTLEADKRLFFEDNFAKLPELRLTFPTVEAFHPDETALNVLGQIIAGSKNSVLFNQVVADDKLAPGVSAYNNSMELAGEFVFRVRAKAGVDLDDVKASIDAALMAFEIDGIDPKDLQRIKAEQETILYNRVATILGKGRQLAQANEFAGDPAYAVKEAAKLQAVTAEEILAAYRKYIKNKPSLQTSFVPKGQAELALEDSELATVWIEEVTTGKANENVSSGDIGEFEKTPTKFDRSEPPFGELPLIKMPEIWQSELGNGVDIYGIENDEIPLVTFDMTLTGGMWTEGADNSGALSLLAALMNEGTENKTAAELEQAIGLLGSGIAVSSGREETRISATTLTRNFEPTVALVKEILSSPRFEGEDFERVKSAALTRIKGREANPRAIAGQVFDKLIYTASHPLGRPVGGTSETVSGLDLDDMKAAHQNLLQAKATIHVAGDIEPARAKEAMSDLAESMGGAKATLSKAAIPPQSNEGKVFFIDVPGSKQSVITIGKLTVATTYADANKLDFTNEKLGGGISGDLGQMLRIEKGYTYGAGSWVSGGTVAQPWRARTSVRANATQPSLEIMRDMISAHGPEFDESDQEITQQKIIKSKTRAFESLGAKLGTLRAISKYGKSTRYVEDEQAELLAMSVEDFQNTAAKYLVEPKMTYLIVGDKETQFGPVQAFARESGKGDVVELDIYGNKIEG
jgi:zinc protease